MQHLRDFPFPLPVWVGYFWVFRVLGRFELLDMKKGEINLVAFKFFSKIDSLILLYDEILCCLKMNYPKPLAHLSTLQVEGIPIIFVSALEGKGRAAIMRKVFESYERWNVRIPTARLNNWLQKVSSLWRGTMLFLHCKTVIAFLDIYCSGVKPTPKES